MEFFTQFGVDWFKLAAQIVNFLVIVYLINRFGFRPMLRLMDERATRIRKGLEDAAAAERDRALAQSEREAALDEARKEAQAMLGRANKIAEDARSDILGEARAEAQRIVESAREEITAEKEKAMLELRAQVADLALTAAGKLVRSEMTGDRQRRLVEEFLSESAADGDGARKN